MEQRLVSPSDLSFLLEECKACFWLKVVQKRYRPFTPFPAVFNIMDRLQKKHFSAIRSHDLMAPGLTTPMPSGELVTGELRVRSQPFLTTPNYEFSFGGKMDMLYQFEDDTVGIVDFKTSEVKMDFVPKYARQLNAYRFSVEHPAEGEAHRVQRMGLLYHTPVEIHQTSAPLRIQMGMALQWVEVLPVELVEEITPVLNRPDCPPHTLNCPFVPHYR